MELTADQQREIDELTAASYQTKRPTVPALEDILYKPFPVLDHGFVRVVDYMGDDSAIVQAARVLRPRNKADFAGQRAYQLSDAAPPHFAV